MGQKMWEPQQKERVYGLKGPNRLAHRFTNGWPGRGRPRSYKGGGERLGGITSIEQWPGGKGEDRRSAIRRRAGSGG